MGRGRVGGGSGAGRGRVGGGSGAGRGGVGGGSAEPFLCCWPFSQLKSTISINFQAF